MKIIAVEKDGTGQELGLQPGDDIVKINQNPVRDILDYRFLVADEEIEMEVLKGGQKLIYEIEKACDDDLGLSLEDIQIRYCGNDCPFCFVDQNPAGMRASMYFRDEDFRLSFLSGHYVTLTNLSKRDMDRIVWQQLSPLFVSVHATKADVRKVLFGIEHDDNLLSKLAFLTASGIEIHTQVVLCPGINDGEILRKTIWDLAELLPGLRSVSVVPVGLTKHRAGLKRLEPVTAEYAADYLNIINEYATDFLARTGEYFVYASDEFYILAGRSIPPAERYDGFYQKENGVGMVRYMLDDFAQQKPRFPKSLAAPYKATFVTATLASGILRQSIMSELRKIHNFEPQLAVVENDFYGASIYVTGLLTGQDIYRHLSKIDVGDKIFLPANCLKENQLFLDDWTLEQMSEKLGRPVEPLQDDFLPVFAGMA